MIMGCIVRSSDLTGQEEGRRGRIANSASIPCVAPDPNRVAEHRVRAYGVVEHKQVGSCAHPTAPVASRGDRLQYAGAYCTQFRKCFFSTFPFYEKNMFHIIT
jgi:hypothetical protein